MRACRVFASNWDDTFFWKSVFVRYGLGNYYKYVTENDGMHVMEQDWDTLFVLDACRLDTFREVVADEYPEYADDIEKAVSRGSATEEFLRENFEGEYYPDTVYVTANPQVDKWVHDSFFDVVSVWRTDWDKELSTVRPEPMARQVRAVSERYPDKRIIAHFLQPHRPFVADPELNEYGYGGQSAFQIIDDKDWDAVGRIPSNPYMALGRGNLSLDRIYPAYRRNLEVVLPAVFELAESLDGRSVVTADHGQAMNDPVGFLPLRVIDHPKHVHVPSLVEVPWLVFEGDGRRDITLPDERDLIKRAVGDILLP